ncbi:choline/ethanolaminephosphotransferase 1 [Histomonas meleagridis]|uniref:choline/ethanolaminephosphotransferase 1 n=1 Tax=Histomonas meleagridis TaxID=135588 RepID=UPI00355AB65C|nr:choline/ethanolaminephosphotransferase 1 [Histomonas meleagridis]KAH0799859.1 choline/ethanolaminephosphotransferase 1 [Histomonas meleagridis]
MEMFSKEDINAAKNYKYNGVDDSILIKLFYRRFWNWLIEFFPLSLAPNLITFIGFLFEVVSFIVSLVYSECLTVPLPSWVCIFNGVCLCIYQTLDNLDGKQARRTGSSSALGQFFDHGCDAITGVSELIKAAASFNLGCGKETFYFVFLMGVGFFLTSYEEYVTHAFYLGYINGPDEGLTLIWVAHILVGFFPSLRQYVQSKYVFILFFMGVGLTVGMILFNVIKKSLTSNDKSVMKRALISILPCLISVKIFLSLASSPSTPYKNPFFTMSAGYVLQYGSQIIIVSFLTKRGPLRTFPLTMIVLWAVALAALFLPRVASLEHLWEGYYVLVVLIMVTFDIRVIRGLSKGLEIPVFTLKKKQ